MGFLVFLDSADQKHHFVSLFFLCFVPSTHILGFFGILAPFRMVSGVNGARRKKTLSFPHLHSLNQCPSIPVKLMTGQLKAGYNFCPYLSSPGMDPSMGQERRPPVTPSSSSRYNRRRSSGSRDERYRSGNGNVATKLTGEGDEEMLYLTPVLISFIYQFISILTSLPLTKLIDL